MVIILKRLFSAAYLLSPLALLQSIVLFNSCYVNAGYAQSYPISDENRYSIQWDTYATSYSPTQPIDSFTDDWDKPLTDGDFAYIQGRSDIRYRTDQSALSYAVNYRYDYLLSFAPSTAQVYWHYKNKSLLAENSNYPLKLSANHNERLGFGIANDFALPSQWQITPQVNIWQGLHGLTGDLDGNLVSKTTYDNSGKLANSVSLANIDLAYQYDKPALKEDRIGWHPSKPNGIGYSLDLHVNGKLPFGTNFAIHAYDILGKMYWRDMPMTDYNFNYNVMGRPPYTLEGKLTQKNLTQSLPWHVQTAIEKRVLPTWSLGVYSEFNEVSDLHQLALTYDTYYKTRPITLTGLVEPQTNAVGIQVKSKDFGIRYVADDLNTNDAKRAAFNFFIRHDW